MDIVMFNMSSFRDWRQGVVNRNYFIWRELAARPEINKIVAVDFLPIGWRKAAAHYWRNILLEPKTSEMVYGDLTSSCYQHDAKTYIYTTIDSFFSFKVVASELRRIEKVLNLKNIVFWSYNPMFTEFIGKLNEKMFVFDAVDNWLWHKPYVAMAGQRRLAKNYQIIATKADLVFTVSESLLQTFKEIGRTSDIHWIANGTDTRHFDNIKGKAGELANLSKPIIGYLGTIEDRVDIDLIVQLAEHHQDKIIALCGPVWKSVAKEVKNKLRPLPNVVLTGRIPYENIPAYLDKFAVAMVPHRETPLLKSMNPMKIYDYLAAGKPVLAMDLPGLEIFKGQIEIVSNQINFLEKINTLIANDSSELVNKRKAFAQKHSWTQKVDQMLALIKQKI